MSRQTLSYQTPLLSSEYFLEEPPHLKTNAMAAMTASSLLLHIGAMVGMVLWIPNIELNLTPPPPVVSFTLAPPPPPPPPPIAEKPVEPVVEPKDVITTASEEAFHAVPEKPEPIPEPVKKPEPLPIPEPIIKPDPIVEPEPIPKPLPEPEPVIEEIPIPEEILEVIEPAVEPMPVVDFPVEAPIVDEAPVIDAVPEVDEAAIRDAYIQQKTIDVFNMVDSKVKYPPLAKKRSIQGTVGLAIHYDAFGFFDSVTIETSSGSAILDKAAQKAAEKALKKSKDLTLSDETLFINIEYRLI